jgi:hypothetical protein
MAISDLSRRFIISVCANGSMHICDKRNNRLESGTLPVFSTNTKAEAEALRVRHCRLARDGSGLYFLNERPANVGALAGVSDMLRGWWEKRAAGATANANGRANDRMREGGGYDA